MNTFANTFKAACVQFCASRDVDENIATVSALVREAARGGAYLVLTPEMSGLIEMNGKALLEKTRAQDDDQALHAFRALAAELGIWVSIGSLAIRIGGDKLANRSFLLTPDGTIAAHCDKIHMFDVTLADGESYRESKRYEPGARSVTADLPWGRFGMTVCYDLRFPALYRDLAQAGAIFLNVPSAFTVPTGRAHWEVLLRARAIENGSYVFAAAQDGMHEAGRETYGHSLIVDPWGEVLADAGHGASVIFAEIDPEHVMSARRKIPALEHDRRFAGPVRPSGSGERKLAS